MKYILIGASGKIGRYFLEKKNVIFTYNNKKINNGIKFDLLKNDFEKIYEDLLSHLTLISEENIFEMPTGGAAIMKEGPNLVYFARKEQGLALGKQLRTNFKINDYRIFRLLPSGEIQFIHPKDGVFPEKVNEGRIAVGKREFSIGKNPNPGSIKFKGTPSYES
jgi:photosystem I subunit 2